METRLRVTFALLDWGDSKALSPFSFSGDEQVGHAHDAEAPVSLCAIIALSLPFQFFNPRTKTAFNLWPRWRRHFRRMTVAPIQRVDYHIRHLNRQGPV